MSLLGLLPLLGLPADADAPKQNEQIRAAIVKALPYIEEKGVWWIKTKKCVSCHRVSFMTWAFAEAGAKGIRVDSKKLAEWDRWSVEHLLSKDAKGRIVGHGNVSGVGQMILGSHSRRFGRTTQTQPMVELIIRRQAKSGTWKPGGQLPKQKRTQTETTQVAAMWLAVSLADQKSPSAAASRTKALKATSRKKTAKTTEWYVARLLVADRFEDAAAVKGWQKKLLALQHSDGGWGWITAEKSDALATGMAVFALRETKTPAAEKPITEARSFLLATQKKGGFWEVNGTKTKYRSKPQETSNFWGTCWAVIALSRTLP